MEDDVRDAVVKASSVLGELGASVEEVSLPMAQHAMTIVLVLLGVEAASTHRGWIKTRRRDYNDVNRVMLLTGSLAPAQAYYKAQRVRSLIRQQLLNAMERYDVLLLPTLGRPAQSIADWAKDFRSYCFTAMFNVASAPAVTLPCGFSDGGLPIGIQIGGQPGEDATVLKVAHAYERATSWHTVRPPNA